MNTEQTTPLPVRSPSAPATLFGTRYRIVTDRWNGFEVQAWRWWWPLWTQVGVNTNSSPEKAKEWLRSRLGQNSVPFKSEVVEYFTMPNKD